MFKPSFTASFVFLLCITGCSQNSSPNSNKQGAAPASGDSATAASTTSAPSMPAPRAAEPDEIEWKSFTPPEGRFTVTLPGAAQLYPSGRDGVKSYGVELPGGPVYMVTEAVSPNPIDDPAKGLAAGRDAQVANNELLFDNELSIQGEAGRDYGFVDQDGDAWHVRIFFKGDVMYQLITMVPKDAFQADDKNALRFFESFQLLDDAGENPGNADPASNDTASGTSEEN